MDKIADDVDSDEEALAVREDSRPGSLITPAREAAVDGPHYLADKPVRLSVNISPDVASALQRLIKRNGTSLTEEIRRAISVYKFIADETALGNKILIEHNDQLLEVKFL